MQTYYGALMMTESQEREMRSYRLPEKALDEIHGLCTRHNFEFHEELVVLQTARKYRSSFVISTLRAMFREPRKTFESPLEFFQRFFAPQRTRIKATERARRFSREQAQVREEVHTLHGSGFRASAQELWEKLHGEYRSGLITEKEYDAGLRGLALTFGFEPPGESETDTKAL